VAEAVDSPGPPPGRPPGQRQPPAAQELRVLALMRLAQTDADVAAATQLDTLAGCAWTATLAAWAWAPRPVQAAACPADAARQMLRALSLLPGDQANPPTWSDDTLAWGVRAPCAAPPAERWARGAAASAG
jgi:hypothetical protein